MELHLPERKIALPEIAGILARIIAQAIAGMSARTSGKRSSGEPSGGEQERPRTGK
jgi:hypothetical protein